MLYRIFGGVFFIIKVDILDGKLLVDKFYVECVIFEVIMEFIKVDINKFENYFGNNIFFDVYDWLCYVILMFKVEIYMWVVKVFIIGFIVIGVIDLQIVKIVLFGIIGYFELMDNFVFIFLCDNKKNIEIIFVMLFIEGEVSNDGGRFFYQDVVFLG